MRFKWLGEYWAGIGILLVITVVSLWLAREGRLTMYIHPRYVVFTTLLCGLGLACAIAGLALAHDLPKAIMRAGLGWMFTSSACLVLCAVLLVLRPAALSSVAAGQRGFNTAAISSATTVEDLTSPSIDYSRFSLKEWASLLAQTSDPNLFADKQAVVEGFVSPAPDDNPDVLYLSRFVVTCCAVDARPISVPVYKQNWRQTLHADQWVEIHGTFIASPGPAATPIVLEPQSLTVISEPHDPYLY